ncbi:Short-chain dehydrogenase/reductase SDR [Oceanicola granulosus HTCC2516]|uniref:Short-chain dehydrogenase/reductase SDR n=1 Tax=Oceanicola granulosus (strain ATCC BAA-861 / DSM 15982 / KCTC 12143 / HTCC2516) TaxID=314256 RepID=Q2CI51_OCEGH|nr:SDR family oxidoreductase [Oceanicola granulosus]EAR52407.1 Short-chain dehydrogenase/reductase SDR [Oceanicola granulosus HTCC2516]
MTRTAIVTGASSGIGRAVAEGLLDNGWRVGLIARRREALAEIARGRAAMVLPCDVTEPTAVAAAFGEFAAAEGRLDLLFNNAGIFTPAAPIDEVTVENWMLSLSVNLTGMFLCARAAFGIMRHQTPRGGRIINNGSISADRPRAGSVTYTAAKHGVTGLTKSLVLDGRPFDIAAGQIDIGNAETEMVGHLKEKARAAGVEPEPTMDVAHVAEAVVAMAELPLSANVLWQTIMATKAPLIGRG